MPAPDVTQTPRDPLPLFSLDHPVPSVLAVREGKTERETGMGSGKGGDTSPWAPMPRIKSSQRKECI